MCETPTRNLNVPQREKIDCHLPRLKLPTASALQCPPSTLLILQLLPGMSSVRGVKFHTRKGWNCISSMT